MPGRFLGAKVLVSIASGNPAKADRVEAISGDDGVISVQVPNERTNVARRKMRMAWPDTRGFPSVPRRLPTVQPMTVQPMTGEI